MQVISEFKKQATPTLVRKIDKIKELSQKLAKIEKEKKELIVNVKEYLGESTELLFNDRLLATYYTNEKPTESINKELLKTKYPDIYEEVKKQTYNRMLLIK